jgi:branched-chain amino acid transport system permease protein
VIRSNYILFVATQVGVYLLVALGLNFLSGFGGQVSLGHGALVAIGAYTTGLLMVDHGWPWWPAPWVPSWLCLRSVCPPGTSR